MSLPDIQKFLRDHPVVLPPGTQDTTVIVVSDSKGSYLKTQTQNVEPERQIIYDYKPGSTTNQCVDYIFRNINTWKRNYGSVLILVWTGTCDLTHKVFDSSELLDGSKHPRKKFIDLNCTAIEEITLQYEKVLSLNSDPCIKVCILDVPYYSISLWNFRKGHPNSDAFLEADAILHERVDQLNSKIHSLNSLYEFRSPHFCSDLVRTRKCRSRKIKTVSWSLLCDDGIHPGKELCQLWIRKIILSLVCKECFH